MCEDFSLDFLGKLPLDPRIGKQMQQICPSMIDLSNDNLI